MYKSWLMLVMSAKCSFLFVNTVAKMLKNWGERLKFVAFGKELLAKHEE